MPDDIGISISYPLPGTSFYERVRSQLGEKQNWNNSDDMALLYRGSFPGNFYHTLYRATHSEFRMRRAWNRLKRDARRPSCWRVQHARRVLAAAGNALKYSWYGIRLRQELRAVSSCSLF